MSRNLNIVPRQGGFTIVELLIVIVIIGVLAALVIVAYTGITARANEASVRSDLRSAANKLEVYNTEYGHYPTSTTEMAAVGIKASKSEYLSNGSGLNFIYCRDSAGGVDYALIGSSSTSSKYSVTSQSKAVTPYSGTFPGSQSVVCPALGLSSSGNYWGMSGGVWASWVGS